MKQGAKATGEKWRDNYQTPNYILSRVAAFLDRYFDPCPANPSFDGLDMDWPKYQGIYINPPFSEYEKWVDHGLRQENIEQIWIMNHDSSTLRMKKLLSQASAICLLSQRVQWIDPRTGEPVQVTCKKTGKQSKGTDPAKSQTLIYLGENPEAFYGSFSLIGRVLFV